MSEQSNDEEDIFTTELFSLVAKSLLLDCYMKDSVALNLDWSLFATAHTVFKNFSIFKVPAFTHSNWRMLCPLCVLLFFVTGGDCMTARAFLA